MSPLNSASLVLLSASRRSSLENSTNVISDSKNSSNGISPPSVVAPLSRLQCTFARPSGGESSHRILSTCSGVAVKSQRSTSAACAHGGSPAASSASPADSGPSSSAVKVSSPGEEEGRTGGLGLCGTGVAAPEAESPGWTSLSRASSPRGWNTGPNHRSGAPPAPAASLEPAGCRMPPQLKICSTSLIRTVTSWRALTCDRRFCPPKCLRCLLGGFSAAASGAAGAHCGVA
mmetsp:Transcript_56760/g.147533  ORF Transcript_56760/g.147533 Transcript_56760/m.147533 type:complete len:232 (-) Transcript_56760:1483-2178(-)